MTKMLEKTLVLPDGLEIAYGEQGDRTGPALLLIHGLSDSLHSFSRMLPHLPEWLRAIAVSVRGHGDSTKALSTYRTDEHARDLVRLMDALALDGAVVAGHSMGSAIAQRVALDHPSRVQGLALLGGFRTVAGNPAVEALWRDDVAQLASPVDPVFVRAFQESTIHKPVPPAFLELVVGESLKVPAFVWRAALRALLEDDTSPELARIAGPSALIWGDHDAFIPYEEQLALASRLAGAELHVLRGVGHAPHWEEPEAVAALLTRFVQNAHRIAA